MAIEIRKVQMTGGSSFVLTLPKDWADSVHLVKNEPLGVIVQPDGSLIITKNLSENAAQRMKRFNASEITDPIFLFRLLIGAYIAGYTTVEIFSKTRLGPEARKAMRDFTRMTIGPEVTEETDRSIVAKDLLNPTEMPLDKTIRRMSTIVKNMHIDAIVALETKNKALIDDIINRDHDVNRLHWLVSRQKNITLRNTGIAKKMGITIPAVINMFLTSRIIERIGDHAVRIAENVGLLLDESLDEEVVPAIKTASATSQKLFERSIEAFFNVDSSASNRVIEDIAGFEKQCTKISTFAVKQPVGTAIALSVIAESIRRTGEYSADISENAINYHVDSEEEPQSASKKNAGEHEVRKKK